MLLAPLVKEIAYDCILDAITLIVSEKVNSVELCYDIIGLKNVCS